MKVVVTGASGQLGSELKDVLSNLSSIEAFFLDRKQLPLDQPILVQDILAMYEPDVVVHAGAYTAVDRAESESELANIVNHLATEEIAQYCHRTGSRMIFISTDYVFDGTSANPLTEEEPVSPINTYGMTKLKGERATQKWCHDAIIIRTSWVYSTYGANFVKTMLRLMEERDEIAVIDDQIGSPTYARDLAQAIRTILMHKEWKAGVYHFSNEGSISWYDFAQAIKEIRQLDCRINAIPTSSYPTAAKRPHYSLLDKTKIKGTYQVVVPDWRSSLEAMLQL